MFSYVVPTNGFAGRLMDFALNLELMPYRLWMCEVRGKVLYACTDSLGWLAVVQFLLSSVYSYLLEGLYCALNKGWRSICCLLKIRLNATHLACPWRLLTWWLAYKMKQIVAECRIGVSNNVTVTDLISADDGAVFAGHWRSGKWSSKCIDDERNWRTDPQGKLRIYFSEVFLSQ